eukprot:4021200-Prymnesium_polylepis.1
MHVQRTPTAAGPGRGMCARRTSSEATHDMCAIETCPALSEREGMLTNESLWACEVVCSVVLSCAGPRGLLYIPGPAPPHVVRQDRATLAYR